MPCFLSLPREIRDRIYRLCLISHVPVKIQCQRNGPETPMRVWAPTEPLSSQFLRCNWQLCSEAAPILYGMNSFVFIEPRAISWWSWLILLKFLIQIGDSNSAHLRRAAVSFTNYRAFLYSMEESKWLIDDDEFAAEGLRDHPSVKQVLIACCRKMLGRMQLVLTVEENNWEDRDYSRRIVELGMPRLFKLAGSIAESDLPKVEIVPHVIEKALAKRIEINGKVFESQVSEMFNGMIIEHAISDEKELLEYGIPGGSMRMYT